MRSKWSNHYRHFIVSQIPSSTPPSLSSSSPDSTIVAVADSIWHSPSACTVKFLPFHLTSSLHFGLPHVPPPPLAIYLQADLSYPLLPAAFTPPGWAFPCLAVFVFLCLCMNAKIWLNMNMSGPTLWFHFVMVVLRQVVRVFKICIVSSESKILCLNLTVHAPKNINLFFDVTNWLFKKYWSKYLMIYFLNNLNFQNKLVRLCKIYNHCNVVHIVVFYI